MRFDRDIATAVLGPVAGVQALAKNPTVGAGTIPAIAR